VSSCGVFEKRPEATEVTRFRFLFSPFVTPKDEDDDGVTNRNTNENGKTEEKKSLFWVTTSTSPNAENFRIFMRTGRESRPARLSQSTIYKAKSFLNTTALGLAPPTF
jgi:hypothetical protein